MKKFKKLLITAMTGLLTIMPLSANVSADNSYDDTLPRVVDNADLLSNNEEEVLSDTIDNIISEYNFDVVIVTEDTLDGESRMNYADDFYDYGGYGVGDNCDGILLLINMEQRQWWISTTGYGITVFTDYGIDKMGEIMSYDLGEDDFYSAFELFLSTTEEYIIAAENGEVFDIYNEYETEEDKFIGLLMNIALGLFIALIIALIVVLVFKSQLKSVKYEYAANVYEIKSSFNVTRSNDVYLYKNVTKRKKPESSGGGGSSTHRSSSGSSHGGGGGSF